MRHDVVFSHQSGPRSAEAVDHHRRDTPKPADTRRTGSRAWRTWTLTASLLAARREFDSSITLAVADPTAPITADPDLGRCSKQSRADFLAEFVDPSAAGFDLLYGTADVPLAQAAGGDNTGRDLPSVIDFTALSGAPRAPPIIVHGCDHRADACGRAGGHVLLFRPAEDSHAT